MGVQGCGNKCMKYLLFTFNLIFLLGALLLVALCIWALVDKDAFSTIHDMAAILGTSFYESALYIVLTFAIAVVLITLLGCCGACREIKCCLTLYFILVFFLAIGLIVGGILFIVYNNEIQDEAQGKLKSSLLKEYGLDEDDDQKAVTRAWDSIQKNLKCCGVEGDGLKATESWFLWQNAESKWFAKQPTGPGRKYVPPSCCKLDGDEDADDKPVNEEKCTGADGNITRPPRGGPDTNLAENDQLHTRGCYDEIKDRTKSKGMIIGIIAIITAVVMLLAMVFAICLCRAVE